MTRRTVPSRSLQTLDDAATPLGSASYTPFGVPQTSTPDPFGFTGELHSQDLVYLRARWYDPSSGGFVGRDPFAGFPETPYSLHPYQYGYSNPVLWRDPSGEYAQLPSCELDPVCPDQQPGPAWILADWFLPKMELICFPPSPPKVIPIPKLPTDIGFIVGISAGATSLGFGEADSLIRGVELVVDLYTFEVGRFVYESRGGGLHGGVEAGKYGGEVWGWSNFYPENPNIENYGGKFYSSTFSAGLPLDTISVDDIVVWNEERTIRAQLRGLSVGANVVPIPFTLLFEEGTGWLEESRSFRHGAYNTPDENDANELIAYIEQSPAIRSVFHPEMRKIIRDNAKAWAEIREFQSKCGELPWDNYKKLAPISPPMTFSHFW